MIKNFDNQLYKYKEKTDMLQSNKNKNKICNKTTNSQSLRKLFRTKYRWFLNNDGISRYPKIKKYLLK